MTRLARIAKGLGALVLLVVLVAGIPWALWHFVGWPLPHHLPTATQVGRALNRQGIPDQTLIDALAVVVWITWAILVISIAVEIPAALSGRHARRLPLAGIFQPLSGPLVAAVLVACLSFTPRADHQGAPGSSTGAATARRPVAALVVDEAAFSGPGRPSPAAPNPFDAFTASSLDTPPIAPAPPAPSPATYVVQRGDTLWGIAERELGDPLKWSEIFQLNRGRPQPDGASLTDPHWIDPGWTLLLPVVAQASPTAPAPPNASPGSVSAQTIPTPGVSAIPPATTSPPINSTSPTTMPSRPPLTDPVSANGSAAHRVDSTSAPVRLPSGSVVAGSFAAGVVATVALGRLRRRHAYRYRPPAPGRDLSPMPLRPTLRHLTQPAGPDQDPDASPASEDLPAPPFDDDERRLDPGRLEIATRDNENITVEINDLSGIALVGPASFDIARAIVAGLLVRAGPGAAEVILTSNLAERLLPGLVADRSVRLATTIDKAARSVQAERIARTRRLDNVGASDAASFRAANPENPHPALLVLLDELPDDAIGRWAALVDGAARLGIAVLFLGDTPAATGHLVTDASRTVTHIDRQPVSQDLSASQLYGLRAEEAVELLAAVTESYEGEEPDDDLPSANSAPMEPITVLYPAQATEPTASEPSKATAWPEPTGLDNDDERPIVVEMLGPFHITVHGETITSGLRGRARALFAWYLLRPEGATSDEAVEALWPDTDPDQVRRQFWRPFGDLRTRFRSTGDNALEVLEKTGEHYRPNPSEITCDLWTFQAALGDAAKAGDDDTTRSALHQVVDVYRGELLSGVGYTWVEPIRQDLHRRALDAHLRLAELEDRAGRPEAAVAMLERVIELDRYAEEPYRRLMALHAAHGRTDAVTATWQLLHRRLADLDLDVDETTARLYSTLTNTDPSPAKRSIRLSS
jgi:DNA-binding SARP family transcriptional activator